MSTFLSRLQAERDELKASIDVVLERAASEDRDLDEAEDANITEQADRIRSLDARIKSLADIELANGEAAELARKVDAATAGKDIVRVGGEAPTYREDADYGFFADLAHARHGDEKALERLQRHREETASLKRDDAITNVDDVVPPRYLMDKLADVNVHSRPVANLIPNAGAPSAQIFYVPKFTTGATVGWQSAENADLATQSRATDSVTLATDTVGGYYDTSVQSLDFSPVRQDEIIFRQLAAKLDEAVEDAVISRDETNFKGIVNVAGKNSVTYTDSSPTLGELYSKIAEADYEIADSRKASGEVLVVSHKMWNWLVAQVDSTGRPIVAPVAPQNAPGSWANRNTEGAAGMLFNYPVFRSDVPMVDEATPTKEQVILFRPSDCLLYETAPSFRIFEDVGSSALTTRFRAHKHVAFTAGIYPESISVISGTGTAVSF